MMKWVWAAVFLLILVWSGMEPADRFTWYLEVLPAVLWALVLWATYGCFRLTPLLYTLTLVHCIVLLVGGHYTYAEVPYFDRLGSWFGEGRNNYDKLGHFLQGFVPALLAREILIRSHAVNGRFWLNLFVVAVALAFSAFYELIEWWVSLLTEDGSDAFLGTQGYVWDTQSDMAMALTGAVLALVLLSRWHDQQLYIYTGQR